LSGSWWLFAREIFSNCSKKLPQRISFSGADLAFDKLVSGFHYFASDVKHDFTRVYDANRVEVSNDCDFQCFNRCSIE
jgi:hypothetical protein